MQFFHFNQVALKKSLEVKLHTQYSQNRLSVANVTILTIKDCIQDASIDLGGCANTFYSGCLFTQKASI